MQSQIVHVVTSCSLPSEISTKDIPLDSILNDYEKDICDNEKMSTITASRSDGRLSFAYADGDASQDVDVGRVVRRLKVADDCHSYNVLLHDGGEKDTLRLSTTRPIARGNELSLWFASEILAAMHVPFLAPENIKGEKNYTCHKCSRTYEYPNPLKMHLSLNDCDKNATIENVLRKLYKNIEAVGDQRSEQTKVEGSSLPKVELDSPLGLSIRDPLDRLTTAETFHGYQKTPPLKYPDDHLPGFDSRTLQRCRPRGHDDKDASATLRHRSAFKPYRQRPSMTCRQTDAPVDACPKELFVPPAYVPRPDMASTQRLPVPQVDGRPLFVLPMECSAGSDRFRNSIREDIDLLERRAVDMETLVSNLGKLKHGHLCLYCGKVYSRKYGLKIHIRTHTGFKPLKCKYCLRPFGDPSNLNKHIRLHAEGETPYRCELCNKILVRRRDLERHMKSRHQTDRANEVSQIPEAVNT